MVQAINHGITFISQHLSMDFSMHNKYRTVSKVVEFNKYKCLHVCLQTEWHVYNYKWLWYMAHNKEVKFW